KGRGIFSGDVFQCGWSLRLGNARFQSPDRAVIRIAVALDRRPQRREDIGVRKELKSRRQHADDGVIRAVDGDALADQSLVRAKTPPPKPIADDRHTIAARLIFLAGEAAAERRRDA